MARGLNAGDILEASGVEESVGNGATLGVSANGGAGIADAFGGNHNPAFLSSP